MPLVDRPRSLTIVLVWIRSASSDVQMSEPFRITADLVLVSLAGEALIDAKQAIPVIIKNIVDLSLSSYEYCLVIVISILIVYCLSSSRKHIKRD